MGAGTFNVKSFQKQIGRDIATFVPIRQGKSVRFLSERTAGGAGGPRRAVKQKAASQTVDPKKEV
jgi:hypothetical protein